ncbi:hypothetical protein BGX31_003707 [Mortierella sp. GBA43]|nr:hypothetical protein BGX31_003707 [Mortierella sp. GBA43]
MSTFDGLIREFPTVAIDNFKRRPGVHVYLLSHVHSDHLSGLAVKSWDSIIYCSQITAKWLPMLATRSRQIAFENGQDRVLQRKYAHLEPYLRPLATDTAHYLDVGGGRKARLSLIPAHHCPGAVMFLLQDDRSCILYTGDARNEAVDLRALGSMPIFSSSTQRIDRLYLDTTLCHQAFQEVPSRDSVISDLITFINRRPRLAHYYIDAWTFGYEDIWIGLAQAFHTKIHVSPYLYRLYEAIDGLIYPRVTPHLTMDGTSARFHSCRLGRTCGYGGAGGEHSSARELIRIQPNVAWFSPILNKERQKDAEGILAQGNVIGRTSTFKIKEKLPPSIGKKDDLCYYINYTFHASLSELQQLVKLVSPRALFPCVLHRDATFGTFFRSNTEIVALLAKSMPDCGFSRDVEEYSDRRICFADGISTDFQSFYRAKGYQVLDMDDQLLSVTPGTSNVSQKVTEAGVVDNGDSSTAMSRAMEAPIEDHNLVLSPRSQYLRRKMDKLKRQLRNTASLEDEEALSEGSSLEDGPLSLDLGIIERKRKWWLEYDRGKSTTQEDQHTCGEDTDPQISDVQSSGPSFNSGSQNDRLQGTSSTNNAKENRGSVVDNERLHIVETQHHDARERKAWFDRSTLELEPQLAALYEDDNLPANESAMSKAYLSSSPDPILGTTSFTGHTSEGSSYSMIGSRSLPSQYSFVQLTPNEVPAQADQSIKHSESHKEPVETGVAQLQRDTSIPSASLIPAKSADTGVKESSWTTQIEALTPNDPLPHSADNSAPTSLGSPPYNMLFLSPSTTQLTRSSTEPPHDAEDSQRALKRRASISPRPMRTIATTTARVGCDTEVILIESDDDNDYQASPKVTGKRPKCEM